MSSPDLSTELLLRLLGGSDANALSIGTRVLLRRKGVKGTVRHVGAVHFGVGDYLGIELDAPVGQHDGTIDGIIYFTCKPRHGTFVTALDVEPLSDEPAAPPAPLYHEAPRASHASGVAVGGMFRPAPRPATGKLTQPPTLPRAKSGFSALAALPHDAHTPHRATALSSSAGGGVTRAAGTGAPHASAAHSAASSAHDARQQLSDDLLQRMAAASHGVPAPLSMRSEVQRPASTAAHAREGGNTLRDAALLDDLLMTPSASSAVDSAAVQGASAASFTPPPMYFNQSDAMDAEVNQLPVTSFSKPATGEGNGVAGSNISNGGDGAQPRGWGRPTLLGSASTSTVSTSGRNGAPAPTRTATTSAQPARRTSGASRASASSASAFVRARAKLPAHELGVAATQLAGSTSPTSTSRRSLAHDMPTGASANRVRAQSAPRRGMTIGPVGVGSLSSAPGVESSRLRPVDAKGGHGRATITSQSVHHFVDVPSTHAASTASHSSAAAVAAAAAALGSVSSPRDDSSPFRTAASVQEHHEHADSLMRSNMAPPYDESGSMHHADEDVVVALIRSRIFKAASAAARAGRGAAASLPQAAVGLPADGYVTPVRVVQRQAAALVSQAEPPSVNVQRSGASFSSSHPSPSDALPPGSQQTGANASAVDPLQMVNKLKSQFGGKSLLASLTARARAVTQQPATQTPSPRHAIPLSTAQAAAVVEAAGTHGTLHTAQVPSPAADGGAVASMPAPGADYGVGAQPVLAAAGTEPLQHAEGKTRQRADDTATMQPEPAADVPVASVSIAPPPLETALAPAQAPMRRPPSAPPTMAPVAQLGAGASARSPQQPSSPAGSMREYPSAYDSEHAAPPTQPPPPSAVPHTLLETAPLATVEALAYTAPSSPPRERLSSTTPALPAVQAASLLPPEQDSVPSLDRGAAAVAAGAIASTAVEPSASAAPAPATESAVSSAAGATAAEPALQPGTALPAGVPCSLVKAYAGVCEQGYSASAPGKPNQDAIIMTEWPEADAVLLAVFDGHGEFGHLVAQHFQATLPERVFRSPAFQEFLDVADNIRPPYAPGAAPAIPPIKSSVQPAVGEPRRRRNVGAALTRALKECEKELLADDSIDCSLSGCTGCVAVICGSDVTVANVGDSRCVLIRTDAHWPAAPAQYGTPAQLSLFPITIDHKPTLPSETRRILLKGGRMHSIKYDDGGEGPVRVWLRDDDVPGLAMSRSLGDTIGKRAGVVSTPDIYHYTLTQHDAFLLLASDGLWEFTQLQEVANTIASTHAEALAAESAYAEAMHEYEAATSAGKDGVAADGSHGEPPPPPPQHLQLALDQLATLGASRWQEREGVVDDTSVIIAEIGTVTLPDAPLAASELATADNTATQLSGTTLTQPVVSGDTSLAASTLQSQTPSV